MKEGFNPLNQVYVFNFRDTGKNTKASLFVLIP